MLCPRAVQLWKSLVPRAAYWENEPMSFQDIWCWWSSNLKEDLILASVLSWGLWNDRNNSVYGKEIPSFAAKCDWIFKYTKEMDSNFRPPVSRVSHSSRPSSWVPPLSCFIKINVDAAWKEASSSGGIGIVARDSSGVLFGAGLKSWGFSKSPLILELMASRYGFIWCSESFFKKIVIESDCLQGIRWLSSPRALANEAGLLIEDILRLANGFESCSFSYGGRDSNQAADLLAKRAASEGVCCNWLNNFPNWHFACHSSILLP